MMPKFGPCETIRRGTKQRENAEVRGIGPGPAQRAQACGGAGRILNRASQRAGERRSTNLSLASGTDREVAPEQFGATALIRCSCKCLHGDRAGGYPIRFRSAGSGRSELPSRWQCRTLSIWRPDLVRLPWATACPPRESVSHIHGAVAPARSHWPPTVQRFRHAVDHGPQCL